MRNTINLVVLVYSFTLLSQRIQFEDPGLNYSLIIPKHWVMVDDGYVIKISPVMRDTATTYLTITYYDPPIPKSNPEGTHFEALELETPAKLEFRTYMHSEEGVPILGFDVRPKKALMFKQDLPIEKKFYDFYRYNKNWEIITSSHADETNKYDKKFKSIIKSLRIETQ